MSQKQHELFGPSQAFALSFTKKSRQVAPQFRSSAFSSSRKPSNQIRSECTGELPHLNIDDSNFIPQQDQHFRQGVGADLHFYNNLNLQVCSNINTFERKPSQKHCTITVLNVLVFLMTGITVLLILIALQSMSWIAIPFIGMFYIFYLCNGCCFNPLSEYCSNMKNYSQFKEQYLAIQRKTGNIRFKASCYHFTSGRNRIKVVSHTTYQDIPLRQCIDISQQAPNMNQGKQYTLCDINSFYCFGDEDSHNTFLNTFTAFRNNNAFDLHQEYTHVLELNLPSNMGLSVSGRGECLQSMYYLFLLIGLGCFYLHYVQCVSQRYSINIKKKLTI